MIAIASRGKKLTVFTFAVEPCTASPANGAEAAEEMRRHEATWGLDADFANFCHPPLLSEPSNRSRMTHYRIMHTLTADDAEM